jgi:uncharacterized protein YxeA
MKKLIVLLAIVTLTVPGSVFAWDSLDSYQPNVYRQPVYNQPGQMERERNRELRLERLERERNREDVRRRNEDFRRMERGTYYDNY